MSAYVTVQTQFKDQECLVKALEEMGYPVEVSAEGTALYGYHGDKRAQKAHVVVRRQHVGSASNDLGWERLEDGSFRQHVSQFDQGATFPKTTQDRLKQLYARGVLVKTARSKGYQVAEEKAEGGKIRLKLRNWN